MADTAPLFSIGFPPNAPTPQEQAGLSTQLAIARGRAEGIQQVARNAVDQALASPMVLADQLVDQHIQPMQDRLGTAMTVANVLSGTAQNAAMAALQAPLRAGIALGYTPQNPQLLQVQRKGRQRTRKSTAGAAQTAQPPGLPVPVPSPPPLPPVLPPASGSGGSATNYYLQDFGPTGSTGCGPIPPVGAGVIVGQNFQAMGPDGLCHLYAYEGAFTPPGGPGGAVGFTIPGPPGGIVGPPVGPPSPKPPRPVPPMPPPPKSPCPCPNINISIPITPLPAPNVFISMPPCPNCGNNVGVVSIPTPANNITINTPPCPQCNAALPPINILVPPSTVPAQPGGNTQPTTPAALPPAPGGATKPTCPTCSIPWLCLNHPQFVIASKLARKSDYDILVDAVNLKLCCGLPELPACSMPLLQREFPEFVQAAKAQGLSDDETLQQAVNIGLCADISVSSGLGETAVGYIAPGSAAALASEFDPSSAGEVAAGTGTKVDLPGAGQAALAAGASALAQLLTQASTVAPFLPGSNLVTSILAGPGSDSLGTIPPPILTVPNIAAFALEILPKVTACLGGPARPVAGLIELIVQQLAKECKGTDDSISAKLTEISEGLVKQNSLWSRALAGVLRLGISLWRTGACFEGFIGRNLESLTGCEPEIAVPTMVVQGIVQVLERWIPLVPRPLLDSLAQLSNWSCPVDPPSSAEANALHAAGWIDHDAWECIVRTNGQRPDLQKPIVNAQRRRPTDDDLLLLYRKQAVDNKQLAEYWVHNGWTDGDAFDAWRLSQQWVASPSDVIDWMIKDVADPQITGTFLTGAEFKQKYTGHVKDVFDWNGISQEDAFNIWKAHWRNMAPTTLYELHKRLRPGWTTRYSDAETLAFAQAICPRRGESVTDAIAADRPISNGFPVPTYCDEVSDAATARRWMESLVTDGYHVSEALGQADYPAFWRQRLLALSYRVLNRTDLGTAYVQGSITPSRLLDGLLDIGYISTDALALQRQDTFKAILRHTRNPACTQFIRWGGDLALVEITLLSEGMAIWMWPYVSYLIQLRRLARIEQQFLRAIQQQYLKGLLNDANAQKALSNYKRNSPTPPTSLAGFPQLAKLPGQLEQQAIQTLLDEMKLLKQNTPKQESAAQICQEFKTGLITGKQALSALQNLNYSAQAAQRILSLCYLRKLPSTLSTMPAPGTQAYAQMQQALES